MVRAIAPLWCANPLPMLTLLLQPLSEGKKLMTTDCFKTYLQEEFVRRCRNNKAYSLRSFARQLSINHSSLSRILSGKRALSENMIQKLAEQLELAPNEIEYFISKKTTPQSLKKSLQLGADEFRYISEWYYLALLELIKIDSKEDTNFYAKRLGIKSIQVQLALETLQRLKLIEKSNTGEWLIKAEDGTNSCTHHSTTAAKKKYQKQVFTMALEAIDNIDVTKRSHSGVSMAINSKKIADAKARIASFREELCEFLQEGELDQVYHLGVCLFPMTILENEKNKKEKGVKNDL